MTYPGSTQDGKIFIIIGTDHDLQNGINVPSAMFADLVLQLCSRNRVDFIAEEANGTKWTHAERLSSFVDAT
jgi:hypothetical protein